MEIMADTFKRIHCNFLETSVLLIPNRRAKICNNSAGEKILILMSNKEKQQSKELNHSLNAAVRTISAHETLSARVKCEAHQDVSTIGCERNKYNNVTRRQSTDERCIAAQKSTYHCKKLTLQHTSQVLLNIFMFFFFWPVFCSAQPGCYIVQ